MLPDLDASFVLDHLQNPTPDDGVALYLLFHDDDTPLLNIDSKHTIDPVILQLTRLPNCFRYALLIIYKDQLNKLCTSFAEIDNPFFFLSLLFIITI